MRARPNCLAKGRNRKRCCDATHQHPIAQSKASTSKSGSRERRPRLRDVAGAVDVEHREERLEHVHHRGGECRQAHIPLIVDARCLEHAVDIVVAEPARAEQFSVVLIVGFGRFFVL